LGYKLYTKGTDKWAYVEKFVADGDKELAALMESGWISELQLDFLVPVYSPISKIKFSR
jgi:hypothetical protein